MVQIVIIYNFLDKTDFDTIIVLMNARTIVTHKYSMVYWNINLFEIVTKLISNQKCAAVDTILVFGLFVLKQLCENIFLQIFFLVFCRIKLWHRWNLGKRLRHLKTSRRVRKARHHWMVIWNIAQTTLMPSVSWLLYCLLSFKRLFIN